MSENMVVIAGISGSLPNCNNLNDVKDAFFKSADLLTENSPRWKHSNPMIPRRTGIINNIEKFDAGFFGASTENLDPIVRIFMERSIEAIFDAGVNPNSLKETKTGVFVGCSNSETESYNYKCSKANKNSLTGCVHLGNVASRLSYFLKLNGPAIIIDTACSTFLYTLDHAITAIKNGTCDAAIVGGGHLILNPNNTLQFGRMGVLSSDGRCKTFDEAADGYARSEGIGAMFLQKSLDAKRIYAKIIDCKTNCDGYKQDGITFPSALMQQQLLESIYNDDGIEINDVTYMETHGTGTKAGDVQEVAAIDALIINKRTKPLLIGSAKTTVGHCEPVSGFVSLVKVLFAMENSNIPPSMHFNKPKATLTGIVEGRLKVVTETTPITTDNCLIGVNNFGFGGANCHVVLEWNQKSQTINPIKDVLPRLVCVSGRTKEAVKVILDDLKKSEINLEYIGMLHNIFSETVDNHIYRGYAIAERSSFYESDIQEITENKNRVLIYFGSFGRSWKTIAGQYMQFHTFSKTFNEICNIVFTNSHIPELNKIDDTTGNFITLMGLADILLNIELTFDEAEGISIGQIVSQYFIGKITLESTIQIFRKNFTLFCSSEQSNNNIKREPKETACIEINGYNKLDRMKSILYKLVMQHNNQNEKYIENFTIFNISDIMSNNNSQIIDINVDDSIFSLLKGLGTLYFLGFSCYINKLYPEIQFPVSRGTQMIGPLIKWNHDKNWDIYNYNLSHNVGNHNCWYSYGINVKDDFWSFITGHVIDGKALFPATGYLFMVWDKFAYSKNMTIKESNQITFKHCKFLRATPIPTEGELLFNITIHKVTGCFKVFENNALVVSGKIYLGCEETNLEYQSNSLTLLSKKDIYKELRLRGYNYKNEFKALQECSLDGTSAIVSFKENWITFMDNMLQVKILQNNSRKLFVPTLLQKITINIAKHYSSPKIGKDEEYYIKLTADLHSDTIRSGGVEIQGIVAEVISRRKSKGEPVLEIHKFVPNRSQELTLNEALRVDIGIILEEDHIKNIKIAEIYSEAELPLSCDIYNILNDQPLIKPDITILTKNNLQLDNSGINISYKEITNLKDIDLIVGFNLLQKENLNCVLGALSNNGFILSFEKAFTDNLDVNVLTQYTIGSSILTLSTRKRPVVSNLTAINIANKSLDWIKNLQEKFATTSDIILYSYNQPESGILGFVNCLRRESGWENIKCVVVNYEQAPEFNLNNVFYKKQLDKNMCINIYKNGSWGTYRHLPMPSLKPIKSSNIMKSQLVIGDLSSLQWIQAPEINNIKPNETAVDVTYAAINFKEIMVAIGRINLDGIKGVKQENLVGCEYAGVEISTGKRIAGMITNRALSRTLIVDKELLFYVPDSWTTADAATVTCVYATVLYALLNYGKIKEGTSILIHSGTGGVGLAAINVALFYKCTVFVTVGTEEKRQFLKEHYPTLENSNIGNSRDVSFESMIKKQTRGRGVDLVLNSLVEEKLFASVKCLADGGTFLEIGKFDLMKNNALQLSLLQKSVSYHGVMLDKIISEPTSEKLKVFNLLKSHISNGCVKPLPRTIFPRSQLTEAFRYMVSGTHIGKVLIDIVPNKNEDKFECTPRFYCCPNKTQIIIGGLGGFGLELADWLINRGAKNIILSSRTGITNGYHNYKIKVWEAFGTTIKITNHDVTTIDGCNKLLQEAKLPVESIFNVAVVLKDAIFNNQCKETFTQSLGPKAVATKHLDKLSREICPNLRNFVVFSSMTSGRGNAGQTNYGMSNSIMERIIEKRQLDGLHGLAIQWGAIGDVGIVADMDEENTMELCGTLQQNITSCMEVLDTFLNQNEPVVSSMVVAEKNTGMGYNENIVEAVASLLGIKNLKTISMHSTLPELGMNSITSVEIKQILQKEFEELLTDTDIRSLTFAKLQELQDELKGPKTLNKQQSNLHQDSLDFTMLLNSLGDETMSGLRIYKLKTAVEDNGEGKVVILFPGIEGMASCFHNMAKSIKAHAYGVQYNCFNENNMSIEQISNALLPEIEAILTEKSFNFIVYSYGCTIGFEIAAKLETKGYTGHIISIDASVDTIKYGTQQSLKNISVNEIEAMICYSISLAISPSNEIMDKIKEKISEGKTFDERLGFGLDIASKMYSEKVPYSNEYIKMTINAIISRIQDIQEYKPTYSKLKTPIKLIQPSQKIFAYGNNNGYGLENYFINIEGTEIFDGDHISIINSVKTINVINNKLL